MKKRITSFFIALLLLLGCVCPEIAVTAQTVKADTVSTYNPEKAVTYADKYWSEYNDSYPNYCSIGGDCANFVSQCLYAGGLPMNSSWYHAVTGNQRAGNWTVAQSLYNYLSKYCGKAIEFSASSISKTGYVGAQTQNKGMEINPKVEIRVGDPVFYYSGSKNRWSHVAICVGFDSQGNPLVSAHNNDHSRVAWKLGTWSRWAVVQMDTQQSTTGRGNVPASALSYKGELWKTIWQSEAGKQFHYGSDVKTGDKVVSMRMYKEPSVTAQCVTNSSGTAYTVFLSSVIPVPEKQQVGDELWGKAVFNGVTGWVLLQKGSFAYARKVSDGTGAIVDEPVIPSVKITGITLDTTNLLLAKNATKTIKVKTYSPSDATTKEVTWSSSNTAVATVDADGVIKGTGKGCATITATAADGSGVKATCKVTVANALYQITTTAVRVRKAAGTSSSSLGLFLHNKEVVSVDSVKTLGKQKWGKITISGKTGWFCISNGKAYAKAISSQIAQMVTKINLSKTSATLYGKNSTATVSVKSYSPTNPTLKGVTWSSSNTKVATVSSGGTVKAVSTGTAVITATAKDGGGAKATCKITVRASKPGKPSISRVKNISGKKITVKLSKKVSGASGYEVQYSTSSKFSSGVKTLRTTSTSVTLKSLTKGKKYYVRVRAYKTDSMGKIYGSYSSVKSVKVTK